MLMALHTDADNSLITYQHPNNTAIESHVMKLLENGKIVVNNRAFSESELSIRSIKNIVYPGDMRHELIVVMAAGCGVKFSAEESADDAFTLSSVEITLDHSGEIIDTGYELSQPPCSELRQNMSNQHITTDLEVVFHNEFIPSQAPIEQISNHINRLARGGQLIYGGFPLSADHFELLSITFNEIMVKEYHGIRIHLTLLCDVNKTDPAIIASPFKVMFFLYPNGEISELYGYFKGEFETSCSQ